MTETGTTQPINPFGSTLAALAHAWRIVTAVVITFYLATWLIASTGMPNPFDVVTPDPRREHLPIFLLSLGAFGHGVSLYLLAHYARICRLTGVPYNARIPWPTDNPPGTDPIGIKFRRWWMAVALLLTVIGPLVYDVSSWRRFLNGDAWHDQTIAEVSLFEPVSPLLFFGHWDDHRYGDRDKAKAAACQNNPASTEPCGISYVPCWQPILLMAAPTLLALAMAVRVIKEAFRGSGP